MSRDEEIAKLLAKHADRLRHLESLEHGIEPFTAHLNNPCVAVYRTGNQAGVVSGNWTPISWQAEWYDTDTMWTLAPNPTRITLNTVGRYHITCDVRWDANAVGDRYIRIRRNGVQTIAQIRVPASGQLTHIISRTWEFAATDYVEIEVFQNSGANRTLTRSADYAPEATAERVG